MPRPFDGGQHDESTDIETTWRAEFCPQDVVRISTHWHRQFSAAGSLKGIDELGDIATLVEQPAMTDRVRIDPSVVRGLEYYTGPVFEAQLTFEVPNEKGEPVVFGSVGGGGRYDGLVGRFRGEDVPATGFSVGVSRLASALKAIGKLGDEGAHGPVVVTVMDKSRLADYQKIVADLRNAGVAAEMYLGSSGMKAQLKYADKRNAPAAIIAGSPRIRRGKTADQGPRRRQGAGGGDRRPPGLARGAPRAVRGGARRGRREGEEAACRSSVRASRQCSRTDVIRGAARKAQTVPLPLVGEEVSGAGHLSAPLYVRRPSPRPSPHKGERCLCVIR